jgi:TolB-like protein/Tfp pilus assembly protein PilF
MSQPAPGTGVFLYRFGVFQFHAGSLELDRQGVVIRLQTQPARLLGLLLASAGELLTRDTICQALWQDGTTVDFEVGINRCIRQLRAALEDDVVSPRYIKTIPRLGYCFIAAVSAVPAAGVPSRTAVPVPAATESQPSIVVLPFANLSGAPEDEYFSDGLTEEITTALAQIQELEVIARTSAYAFKGKHEDVRTIAAALGVGYVLEGSVRRSGTRLRVTGQMIRGSDGVHIFSKSYDREMTDIFSLQDEIAQDVALQLRLRLGVRRHSKHDLQAYEAYLEGRYHWHKYNSTAFKKGLQCFDRAVAIDPAFAPAFTGIAQCCVSLVTEGGEPAVVGDLLQKSAAAARRAIELDANDAEAHAALGTIAAIVDYDWDSAERYVRRALTLNPSPHVRMACALWYLLPQGRAIEAAQEAEKIIAQDPLHLTGRQVHAACLWFAGETDRAAEACLRLLEIDSSFGRAVQMLASIRSFQGRAEEGLVWARRFSSLVGTSYASLWTMAMAYAGAGDTDAACRALEELRHLPGSAERCPGRIGSIYAVLGQPDRAFEWLDKAVEVHEPTILWLRTQPRLETLRPDPRFRALLEKLHLAN